MALLAVALLGVAAIAIAPNLGAPTPSGGVLGATGVPTSALVPTSSAPGTQPSAVPGATPAVVAALRGTAVVNDRLATDADILAKALARKNVRAIDLARQLRAMASDAELGIDLANRLVPWPDADPLRADLKSFYETVTATARDGLRSPLGDTAAYKSAAASMLSVMTELQAIDAASRDLADAIPAELPPITVSLPE